MNNNTIFHKAALTKILAKLAFVALGFAATAAYATNYSLWVNGRGNTATPSNYNAFNYWGPSTTAAGVNKVAVNWDGYNSIASQHSKVKDAFDCFCTGKNWCYVATHSAGDLMTGYVLSNYGTSTRTIKTPPPPATTPATGISGGGQCVAASGAGSGTQTGWNIKWVRAAGGAGGGSELADYGVGLGVNKNEPLVADLKTTTARAMFNHNVTSGIWFYMAAGAKGTLYSAILPGQDDEAVAYHSSGGISGTSGIALGNPADLWSNDLNMLTAVNEGGSTKWSWHSVVSRDDSEVFNHYANSAWQGIISVVRAAMASLAI